MVRKCLSGLSAIADKTRILLTKSKDKLCHDEFLSRFLHLLKISKMSNFVRAWSAHETSWHSLPMDSISSFRIHLTSFQSFKIHEFLDKRKLNFSELNDKLVAVFTTKGVENLVSYHCLTFFFLLWMLKKYFYHIPSVLSGVLIFRKY